MGSNATPNAFGAGLLIHNLNPFGCGTLRVEIAQSLCHWAGSSITDLAIVDLRDGGQLAHRTCAKHFAGAVNIDQ